MLAVFYSCIIFQQNFFVAVFKFEKNLLSQRQKHRARTSMPWNKNDQQTLISSGSSSSSNKSEKINETFIKRSEDDDKAHSFLSSLKDENGEAITVIFRKSDGYINATRLCKEAGKEWKHYYETQQAKDFLKTLQDDIQSKQGSDETLLVDSITTGPNDKRGTWIHPAILNHLTHWCRNKRKRVHAGIVYLVTSKCLNAIKIGMWTGTEDSLRGRYVTPIGPSVTVYSREFSDCAAKEKQMHQIFSRYRIEGELFDKSRYDDYKKMLDSL